MNQILSQNEVEALLKAVGDDSLDEGLTPRATEEGTATAVAPGTTRAAIGGTDRRFEEVKPLLEDIFDLSIKGFRSFLLGALAKDLAVERFLIELVNYQDFARRYDLFGRPYTFMPFELTPPERTGVVIFEPSLAIGLMEGFMGGMLEHEPVPIWRPLTTLELKVAERMNRELLDSVAKALQARLGVALEPLKIMTNAHLVKGMKEMSSVVAVGIRILIRGKPLGECYVLLPQDVVDSFNKTEGNQATGPSAEELMHWDQALMEGLFGIDVQVTAELGSLPMSVRKLLSLKVGDMIPLDNARPGEAIMKVEGIPKMKAMPGIYRGRKALRLV
jgi:flagellar motor switch protein FliM